MAPWFPREEAEEVSIINADLLGYAKQKLVEWIVGDADPESEWDSYLRELEKIGLERWLEVHQAGYERLLTVHSRTGDPNNAPQTVSVRGACYTGQFPAGRLPRRCRRLWAYSSSSLTLFEGGHVIPPGSVVRSRNACRISVIFAS